MQYNAIILNRGEGKTKALIEHCVNTGAVLVVANQQRENRIKIDMRKYYPAGVDIKIITYDSFVEGRSRFSDNKNPKFAIDDLEQFAQFVCSINRGDLDTFSLTP